MPYPIGHQPLSTPQSVPSMSAYPSMKQFTFPIAPASASHSAAAASPSSATVTSSTFRPPSAQRSRGSPPIRASLSHTSFPTRASTASSASPSAATPSSATTAASDFDGVNARVDRKFAYWKSYWATVQQHAAASCAESAEQQVEEKQQTSAAAGTRSREQLEAVIRRMRETREEEMASSTSSTPREAAASDKAQTADMHEKRWDASPRLHRTEAERKRGERRRTIETKSTVEQSPKSSAHVHTEQPRSPPKPSASPAPSASPTRASSSAASAASPSPSAASSNLHRFWQDEQRRAPHSHHYSAHAPAHHSTAQSTRRRKMEHLTLPADPEQARRLWEAMKLEMWQQWEQYQRKESAAERAAGKGVRVEEEKEEAEQQPQGSPQSASSFGSAFSFRSSSSSFSSLHLNSGPFTRASSHHVPSSSESAHRPPSGRRSTEPNGPLSGALSGWSVRELRAELLRLNLSTHDCLEKSDMVDKLSTYQQQQQRRQSQPTPQSQPQPPPAVDAEQILADIRRWSHGKSIVQLLNDLNRELSPTSAATATLSHDSSVEEVSRAYKKTLLRVHPDKCGVADEEKRVRATEVFKVIHERFVQFKDKHEKRAPLVL